ncbi:hypothetical protein AMTR_s00054p00213000, partial [Amborella trichopoda]
RHRALGVFSMRVYRQEKSKGVGEVKGRREQKGRRQSKGHKEVEGSQGHRRVRK